MLNDIIIFGSDERIIRAAKISHMLQNNKNFNKAKDIKLMDYLYKNKHASPFEHVILFINAEKNDYLKLLRYIELPNPIYFENKSKYIVMNLRTFINIEHIFKEQLPNIYEKLMNRIKNDLPTVYNLVFNRVEPLNYDLINYTRESDIINKGETYESGHVILLHKFEFYEDSPYNYYTFLVSCPIFVARQWMRHRLGSFNELSRRYVSSNLEYFIPNKFRIQDTKNKQASFDFVEEHLNKIYQNKIIELIQHHIDPLYNEMVNNKIAKELARGILPLSLYTSFYWTVPRISLDNFIGLRRELNAQKEIRDAALAIEKLVGYYAMDKLYRL